MTETEKKALALVNDVSDAEITDIDEDATFYDLYEALCRAIEQHEAFRQEVSDAVERVFDECEEHIPFAPKQKLRSFIIAKPDPLVEALDAMLRRRTFDPAPEVVVDEADNLRAAIEARGGRIVWEGE